MLRVLTLASLFPDETRPNFGIFVERQTLGLSQRPDVEVQVVAPVGAPPFVAGWNKSYRARMTLPPVEHWKGLLVHRPRFPTIPLIGSRFTPALLARSLLPLLREIERSFPFDVIDAEFFWPDGPAAIALGKKLGVPVSIKARGSDIHHWGAHRSTRRQIVSSGRSAHGMLAVSAALKQDMITMGMPGDRITVHYTGVDLDRFKPIDRDTAKAKMGIRGPLLVSVGHLIDRKGQALAIEALQALPDAALLVVGDGPDRALLERNIADYGLTNRAYITGPQPHEMIPTLLAAADVMVLPSASEGLANVWVEALACGTPIVIADVGGGRELLDRPEAGRLVKRDAASIAQAIRSILAHPPAQALVRQTAERFTWERNAETLEKHLRKLASAER